MCVYTYLHCEIFLAVKLNPYDVNNIDDRCIRISRLKCSCNPIGLIQKMIIVEPSDIRLLQTKENFKKCKLAPLWHDHFTYMNVVNAFTPYNLLT